MRLHPFSRTDLVLAGALLAGLFVLAAVLSERWRGGGEREVSGPTFVVDGDTLDVRGQRVRLAGIDAPELHQTCGEEGHLWNCGEMARIALQAEVNTGAVRCRGRAFDIYHRLIATCFVGDVDIGEQMVSSGLAIADGAYRATELEARVTRRGIWFGPFQRPVDWRAEHLRGTADKAHP